MPQEDNFMQKICYVYGGQEFHDPGSAAKVLAKHLQADGRFELEITNNLDVFCTLDKSKFAAVVVYVTNLDDQMTPDREKGLLEYVRSGGGFVGVHSAIASFRGSKAYLDMLNGEFDFHPEQHEFKIKIVDPNHYITTRVPDFTVYDEMYHLKGFDPSRCTVLAQTEWQGKQVPMAYVRNYGKGRLAYLAPGHADPTWKNPEFIKMLIRSIAWSAGAEKSEKTVHCGLLGYGPAFNMGKGHAEWINAIPGMKTIAMCDVAPDRVAAARKEIPDLEGYYTDVDQMLKMPGLDLVVNILPHNLHAPMTLKCLDAGKHVVLEKPFCLNVAEATAMVDRARQKGLMLSLFHNRRWDGDYLTLRDLINRGLIGDVYHIEACMAGYNHPGFWWRSNKDISGGVMHDWGAHFLDWILNLVPSRMTQVMGDFQKRVWHAVTNEDHGQAYIRFENGVTADFLISSMAAIPRPKWLIYGTKGSLQMQLAVGDEIQLTSFASGVRLESKVKVTLPGYGTTQYYRNVADHLLLGEELLVKPEQARRVIAVIEAAEQSSKLGHSVTPAFD
jgi:scyllo-inositol 2-dehydrogenase (NADP+)